VEVGVLSRRGRELHIVERRVNTWQLIAALVSWYAAPTQAGELTGLTAVQIQISCLVSFCATTETPWPNMFTYTVGWVDIGIRTKVPLRFVTYLSKVTKINEKSVLTQWPLHHWSKHFGSCTI
jgi:hypothetical protein